MSLADRWTAKQLTRAYKDMVPRVQRIARARVARSCNRRAAPMTVIGNGVPSQILLAPPPPTWKQKKLIEEDSNGRKMGTVPKPGTTHFSPTSQQASAARSRPVALTINCAGVNFEGFAQWW